MNLFKRDIEHDAVFVFFKKWQKNVDIKDIKEKLYTINRCYTLQFDRLGYDINALIKRIQSCGFDNRVKNGDLTLVADLQKPLMCKKGKEKQLYSFATKYCAIHSWTYGKDDYMIYDSINVAHLKGKNLNIYENYYKLCKENMLKLGIQSFADFDEYLQNLPRGNKN